MMETFDQGVRPEPSEERLLIVEDDPEMGTGLEKFFSLKGYEVVRAANGEEAVKKITRLPPYDVVLLDVMLPNKDGFEVLREARKELAARVQAVLRRSQPEDDAPKGDVYTFGDVEVDFNNHTARRDGEEVEFTALEFDILEYFIQHRGRTVSRKQLLRDVWGISGDITTRTIDRHVASLRKKIEADPTDPEYIETVYGVGYKFVG